MSVTLQTLNGKAYITVQNTSAYEITFTKEEILERFTRGDSSRTTEGTGLGLSIAKGFTLACGGNFDIELDGDMLKVILSFKLAEPAVRESDDDSAASVATETQELPVNQ